jgi:structural maintenance of chromosomes protein 5
MNALAQTRAFNSVYSAYTHSTRAQRLRATQKAIGGESMVKKHDELIVLRKQKVQLQNSLQEMRESHERDSSRLAILQDIVNRYEERREIQLAIAIMTLRLHWLRYEVAREAFMENKSRLEERRRNLAASERELNPLKGDLEEAQRVHTSTVQQLADMHRALEDAIRRHQEEIDMLNRMDEEMETNHAQVEALDKRMQKSIGAVNVARKEVEEARVQLQALDDTGADAAVFRRRLEQATARLGEIKGRVHLLTEKLSSLNERSAPLRTREQELQELASEQGRIIESLSRTASRREDALRSMNEARDALACAEWIRHNGDRFRGNVYGPLLLFLQIPNQETAIFLERVIPRDDLFVFVCEQGEDQMLLLRELRDRQRLRISVVRPDPNQPWEPAEPIERYRQYGFRQWLVEAFEAPKTVKQHLCSTSQLHRLPIGSAETERMLQRLLDEGILRRFITPQSYYVVRPSRFGASNATSSSSMKPARYLQPDRSQAELSRVREEQARTQAELAAVVDSYGEMTAQDKQLRQELEELGREKRTLSEQLSERRRKEQVLQAKERRLTELDGDVQAQESELSNARRALMQANVRRAQRAMKAFQAMSSLTRLVADHVECAVRVYHVCLSFRCCMYRC